MSDDANRTIYLGKGDPAKAIPIPPLRLDRLVPIGWVWDGEMHYLPGKSEADLPPGWRFETGPFEDEDDDRLAYEPQDDIRRWTAQGIQRLKDHGEWKE